MKRLIIALIVLVPCLAQAQGKKFELGISVGNNGMFKEVHEELYDYDFFLYDYESYEVKSSNLKFTLSGRYFLKDHFSLRLKAGFAREKGEFDVSDGGMYSENAELKQNIISFNPGVCFSKSLDKFEVMTGLELPLMIVGEIEAKSTFIDNSSPFYPQSGTYTETISGGLIWGISSFIGVRYNFNQRIAIGSEIDFGLLFANVGDEIEGEYEDEFDNESQSIDGEFKQTYFSTPEVSLGIYFTLGGAQEAAK